MRITTSPHSDQKEIEYPWLGISKLDGSIVLFSEHGIGTVIKSEYSTVNSFSPYIGYHGVTWDMSHFEGFNGTITLEN